MRSNTENVPQRKRKKSLLFDEKCSRGLFAKVPQSRATMKGRSRKLGERKHINKKMDEREKDFDGFLKEEADKLDESVDDQKVNEKEGKIFSMR